MPARRSAATKAWSSTAARSGKAAGPGSGEVLLELALAVSHQGRYDEAGSLFRRAEPIVQRREGIVRGRLFAYLAIDASLQGRYQDGLGHARESMVLRRREVDPN